MCSLTCRRRHLKCDEEKPRCGRCRRTARECIPDSLLTFRSAQKLAARGQIRGNGSTAAIIRNSGHDFQEDPENDNIFAEDHQWLATPSMREGSYAETHLDWTDADYERS